MFLAFAVAIVLSLREPLPTQIGIPRWATVKHFIWIPVAVKNVRNSSPMSERLIRSHSLRPDSAKTYEFSGRGASAEKRMSFRCLSGGTYRLINRNGKKRLRFWTGPGSAVRVGDAKNGSRRSPVTDFSCIGPRSRTC